MRSSSVWVILISVLSGGPALAAEPPAKPPGPCEQIAEACKSAGFIQGDYKSGNGLHVDCIDPIMRGATQPPTAKIPLPKVSADTVAACKQKHPDFGEGKKSQPAQQPKSAT